MMSQASLLDQSFEPGKLLLSFGMVVFKYLVGGKALHLVATLPLLVYGLGLISPSLYSWSCYSKASVLLSSSFWLAC